MFKAKTRNTRRQLLAAGFAALVLTVVPAFAAHNTSTVQARDAWIRWLSAGLPAAGYVTLSNPGDKPVVLVGAKCAAYDGTTLHETRNRGGVSEMEHVDKITIPVHGTMAFQPGGYHIMLMKAKKQLTPGDMVPITLLFEGGDSLTVDFEVRNADGGVSGGRKGMDKNGMHNMKD